jgi:sugar phosphate isomerase/epimerase
MQPAWKQRLAVSELSTIRWSFEEDVVHYHELGFSAIGVWREKLADFGIEKGAELLEEHGMRVSSLQWVGGFTGSDGRTYREALCDALDAVDLAAKLKASCLVVLSGARSGHTRNHARRLLKQALRELGEAAQAVGVSLALEPMHRGCAEGWTFLTGVPETLDLIASIDRPTVGMVFDCYHLAHDPLVTEWLPSIVPSVRLVQLGDAKGAPLGEQNRCLLGRGRLPLGSVVAAFEQHGYQGMYELEILGEEVEHMAYQEVLHDCQRAMDALFPPLSV